MKNNLIRLFAMITCGFFISSCVSLTGFEEGRTLGEGNSEIIILGNLTKVPDLLDEDSGLDSLDTSISFPNIELSYKLGVAENLDIGARISSNFNASAYAKYQVVGDRSSSFALAPGLEIGSVASLAYNVGVPIYMSYYPADAVAINVTPRFMYQTITGDISTGATYLGGNFGLLFGTKNKFGLDIGYYSVSLEGSEPLLTFELGVSLDWGIMILVLAEEGVVDKYNLKDIFEGAIDYKLIALLIMMTII